MDYSATQEDNLQPGKVNFDLLVEIYGTVKNSNDDNNATNDKKDSSPPPPRHLRGSEGTTDNTIVVPESIADQYYRAAKLLESMTCLDCEMDLGEGYRIVAHKLHVFE